MIESTNTCTFCFTWQLYFINTYNSHSSFVNMLPVTKVIHISNITFLKTSFQNNYSCYNYHRQKMSVKQLK